ncbi:hypothetical protein A4X13_0g1641 [Tilletia indica]|uniref:RPAP1 N-terminal domain-containing protein n=1 Tax=Tilletia indica TaxID=43049 RepID=A0A177TKH0_9BASI|nr:hypothetical protein A4X13_0g1641 [Tilletia indica]
MEDNFESSPLSGVRERATRSKFRAPPSRADEVSSSNSSGPKKSRFQLAKEAERLKAEQSSTPSSQDVGPVQEVERKDVPDPTDLPSAQSNADEIWLDTNGVPLSAFKKAMLQRRGLGPPGRVGSRSQPDPYTNSSSSQHTPEAVSTSSREPTPSKDNAQDGELETISRENDAKVAAMSPDEVKQEVEELQDQIGSDLLEKFRQLATLRSKATQQSAERQEPGQASKSEVAPAKKSVSFDIPVKDSTTASGSSQGAELVKNVEQAPSELHFHEHTSDPNLDAIRLTHSGSFVSATSASQKTNEEVYSMPMLLSLVQSSAPTQRQLGLTVLARAISSSSSDLETLLGAEKYIKTVLRVAALAARYTLSDRHRGVISSARRCLIAVLSALSSGRHLDRRRPSRRARNQTKQKRDGSQSTASAAAAILSAGGNGFPEDLERDLTQSLPNSSAASLLVSDLLQSGLVSGLQSDLVSCDRILSTKVHKTAMSNSKDLPAELTDAIEAVTETASILQMIARTSDLHAENIVAHEDEAGHHTSSGGDTALQILVRQGIRARRWPRLDDGQPHLDVIPEVLALVATICNSTPRAALKLTQQTNIANTLLRFIALPPWGLDDSEGEAKPSTETDSESWMLRNWELFSSTLLAYGGLSKHSLEGALLDAWSLWLDVSDWTQQATFLDTSSSPTSVRLIQIRCASRLLQLFGSWIARAASSEGDFEDLTWTDVSTTKDVALAVLDRLAGQPQRSTESVGGDIDRAQGSAHRSEELHLLASAVTLLSTWLQAATDSARNPALQLTTELRMNVKLNALFGTTLAETERMLAEEEEGNDDALGGDGREGKDDARGQEMRLTLCTSAVEAIQAIHELSRHLAMATGTATAAGAGLSPSAEGRHQSSEVPTPWRDLAKGTAKVAARFAALGIDDEERRLR